MVGELTKMSQCWFEFSYFGQLELTNMISLQNQDTSVGFGRRLIIGHLHVGVSEHGLETTVMEIGVRSPTL